MQQLIDINTTSNKLNAISIQFYMQDALSQQPDTLEQIIAVIRNKKDQALPSNKSTLHFKQAEIALAPSLPPSIQPSILQLQKQCLHLKIPAVHSYFVMRWAASNSEGQEAILKEVQALKAGSSCYQSIRNYIRMRQHLLGKINQFSGNYLKSLFQDIDDIRFLNFEIVSLVQQWKQQWGSSQSQPLFYEGSQNYLLKMANDNADLINVANFKKTKFISPPNPFFLSQDGNLRSMTQQQQNDIQKFLQLLNEERTTELRIAVQGAPFLLKPPTTRKAVPITNSKGPQREERSFTRQAREQLDSKREQQIKNIYAIKSSVSSARLRAHKEVQLAQARKLSSQQREADYRAYESQRKLPRQKVEADQSPSKLIMKPQKIKKQKATVSPVKKPSEIKDKEESRLSYSESLPEEKITQKRPKSKKKQYQPYQTFKPSTTSSMRNIGLRGNIDKALSTMRVSSSRLQPKHEVREIRPKIKLIQQKETSTEDINKVLNLAISLATSSPKPNAFFKKIEPIEEEQEGRPQEAELKLQSYSTANGKLDGNYLQGSFKALTQQNVLRQQQQLQKESSITNKNQATLNRSKLEKQLTKRASSSHKDPSANLQRSQQYSNRPNQDSKLRSLSTSLKNLTIINIYKATGKQRKKHNSSSKVQIIKQQPIKNSSFITQIDKPLRGEIEAEAVLNESQLSLMMERKKLKNKQHSSYIQSMATQLEEKSRVNQRQSQSLKQKEKQRINAEEELHEKTKAINELQSKIKALQGRKQSKRSIPSRVDLQKQKKKGQIQSKILKDQIRKQQQRLIANRERQLRLRQLQLQRQLKISLKAAEKDYSKKMKQYQLKLKEEAKRSRQTESLLEAEKKKIKRIEQELAQKELKERLLKTILEQKEQDHQQTQEDVVKRLEIEIKEKEAMEQEVLAQLEEEKTRMQQIYQDLIERNRLIEQENQQKHQLLQQAQRQRQLENQKLVEIQQNLLLKEEQTEKEEYKHQEEKQSEAPVDEEILRKKIKDQLLSEMLKRQEQERLQQEQEQERKRAKLKKIQEEVALALKEEEEKIEHQNRQFMKRLENIRKQTMLVEKLPSQGQQNNVVTTQHQEKLYFKPVEVQQQRKKDAQPIDVVPDKKQEDLSEPPLVNPHQEELPQPILPSLPAQQKVMPPQNQQGINNNKQQQSQPSIRVTQQEQPQTDILEKYRKLGQHLRKAVPLCLDQSNLPVFLDAFLGSTDHIVRSMFPWSKDELAKNILSKRGDIFDSNCLGWLEEPSRYILVGSGLHCIGYIADKYGSVQVHQLFLFDKTNPYQKQALAKKIKDFESIGFVFQKKAQKQNIFSIRFVVKIPKELAGPAKIFGTHLTSTITLQGHTSHEKELQYYHAYSYLLSRVVQQNFNPREQIANNTTNDHFGTILKRQIQLEPISHNLKGLSLQGSTSLQMRVELNLKYFRQKNRVLYLIPCTEYQHEGIHSYVHKVSDNFYMVIRQHQSSQISLDHICHKMISQLQKSTKSRMIDVLLPVWTYSSQGMLTEPSFSYNFREKMEAQLNIGSISAGWLVKHDYVEIRPPFLVMLAQGEQVPRRILHGHLVNQDEIIYHSLK